LNTAKLKSTASAANPPEPLTSAIKLKSKKAQVHWIVDVLELSEQRGPAKVAQNLYQETEASQKAREDKQLLSKLEYHSTPKPEGRPSKKDRREIQKLKRKR
jgi:hypothetical protein